MALHQSQTMIQIQADLVLQHFVLWVLSKSFVVYLGFVALKN